MDNYEVISKIGSGASGDVYKVMKKGYPTPIAVKIINVGKLEQMLNANEEDILATIGKEVQILSKLSQHCKDFFVLCYLEAGSYYDREHKLYFIETEYLNAVDMYDFGIDKNLSPAMKYYYLLLIARDVSYALRYIHQSKYIHNDIKLENILINIDTSEPRLIYSPKVIDFGLSCHMNMNMNCKSSGGTPGYFAPEYFTGGGLRLPESDMWSLGCTLFAACDGKYPFSGDMNTSKLQVLSKRYPRLHTTNKLLNDIVNGLIQFNPKDRLTPDQIINMLWDVEKTRPAQ